jgi:hypothetical protein
VEEAQPAWHASGWVLAARLIQPLAAMVVLLLFLSSMPAPAERLKALKLGVLMICTAVLFMQQVRWGYYFYPVVVLALVAYWRLPANSFKQMGTFLAIAFTPFVLFNFEPIKPTQAGIDAGQCHAESRLLVQQGRLEQALEEKPLTVLATTNIGTEILFFTPYRIVASNYHREAAGMRDVFQAFAEKDEKQLYQLLKRRKIDAVMVCPIAFAAPDSVLMKLWRGEKKVDFLKPVALPEEEGIAVVKTQEKASLKKKRQSGPALFLVQ